MILFQALKMRASDVHIQPYEDKLQVRYRVDGILYDMMAPPKKIQDAVLSRIKIMGKMDIAERRLAQDGGANVKLGDSDVDIRISSVPTIYGERIVMRLLDKSSRLYDMEELGLEGEEVDDLQAAGRRVARHRAGHRPDRQRQDHVALRGPQEDQHDRIQRDDDRGPGRVPPPGHQPDRGESRRRA